MRFLMLVSSVFFSFLNMYGVFNSPLACFRYTDSGNCRECFPGYLGANCSHTCRYPSYGKGCQGVCHCEREECHAVIGCSQSADCRPGYFGYNCIHQCRFPSFGLHCQNICDCDAQHCDKETGCKITRANIASTTEEIGTTNRERTTLIKLISQFSHTHEQKVKTRLSAESTTFFEIKFSNTNFVYGDIAYWSTQERIGQSTATTMDQHNNKYIISNSTDRMYVYIISVIGFFLIVIVVSNILFILHRKARICSNTDFTHPLHFKRGDIEIECRRMSTHTTNQTDTSNSPYEIINIESDDSESIKGLNINTSFETSNQHQDLSSSSISRSYEIIDADGYQCPILCKTRENTSSRDTSSNDYLTVI